MHSLWNSRFLPSRPVQGDLALRFGKCLKPVDGHRSDYSQEILSEAFQTPSALPSFHPKLLDSYAAVPFRGTSEQYFTAVAVKHVFRFNAMLTPRGSFQNAVLQTHLSAALMDRDRWQGVAQLAGLFQAMTAGWDGIDALTLLRHSPYASFLREPCFEDVRERHGDRSDASYLADPRLNQHLDYVLREVERLRDDAGYVRSIRRRLEESVLDFLMSGREPDARLLMGLVKSIDTPQARELLSDGGDFEIVFADGTDLDRLAAVNGLSGRADAFFVPPQSGEKKGTFLLRAFPRFDRNSEAGREAAFGEILNRLIDLFHEWRHGRDALKEGIFADWKRRDRIAFEVRALLEEHLFRVTLGEENFERTASQMGDSLVSFLIHFADWLYR